MEKKLNKALDAVILSITESDDFIDCIRIKEKMDNNNEIKELVDLIKVLQKKYVKTMDDNVKRQLNDVQMQLDNIPLYDSYQKKLSEVNKKIDIIKDELNYYFYKVVNEEKYTTISNCILLVFLVFRY